MDLRQPGEFTGDLFAHPQPAAADNVMSALDEINLRWDAGRSEQQGYLKHRAGLCDATSKQQLHDKNRSALDSKG